MTDEYRKGITQDNFERGRDYQQSRAHETLKERRRGRPKGSKNAVKGVLQPSVAQEMLDIIKPMLPDAEYKEIQEAISTIKQVKILLALMMPPIAQRLVEEARGEVNTGLDELEDGPESKKKVEFYRDTNERIKVFNNLATLAAKLEGEIDEGTNTGEEPLFEQFKRRGLVADRFTITGSIGPGAVGGNGGGPWGSTDNPRTVSDQLFEGHESLEDSEEIETTRVLDTDSNRDDPLSGDEAELQRGHSIDGGEGSVGEDNLGEHIMVLNPR
jgi:hypothetical protein